MSKPLLCLLGLLVSVSASATQAPAILKPQPPKAFACTVVKPRLQENNIILEGARAPTQTNQAYFIKNVSSKSIWLDHPVKNPSASAGWSSYLRPGNWSVFLLDKKDFALNCSVIHPGKVEILNCTQALSICAPKNLAMTTSRKGSYWVVEDKSYEEALKIFQKRTSKPAANPA